ncbi:sialic acid-binding Ig-like lectin 13 [Scyliorhinus canicula]|uniref:sialic acid-binding Ig-like lectin 13 n=1 Tax=Scyliorhinus canicula TaxID=7830 RepID=UPI0018F367E2|nr:sialic acid-binding Ig-like lectin 13 [Scyliorhinus canicula]
MDYIGILVICILLRGVSSESDWSMMAPGNVTAFHHSCIVIPCNCTFPRNLAPERSTMIWFKGHDFWENVVARSTNAKKDQSDYKYRVSLLNSTALNNCTLLIENVSQSDGGKYIFRLEVNQESRGKYTYRVNPVYIHVSDFPNGPVLWAPGSIVEQIPANLSCHTDYSCLLEPPNISWTGLSKIISIKQSSMLPWQYSSTVTFEPSYKDHGKTVKCLVQYPRMKVTRIDHINLTIKSPVSWTIILTICGVCLFIAIVLVLTVLKYRSSRNGQRDVAGSARVTETANPIEASQMAKNVYGCREEPVYSNVAAVELSAIYANCELKGAACNPRRGQGEAASAGSPRKLEEELYTNLGNKGTEWSGSELYIY